MTTTKSQTTTPSESAQRYLVSMARLQTDGKPVPLSRLAGELGISPISVNEMCRKLQDQGLVIYRPYKGASLTPEGKRLALRILRCHRLWEVFLVERLGFEYDQAHEIACALERATPELLADRLDLFLDHPQVNPRGEPIPTSEGRLAARPLVPLTALTAGQKGYVARCDVDDKVSHDFLQARGIRPGATLTVLVVSDDNLLIQVGDKTASLARALAEKVQINAESSVSSSATQSITEETQTEMEAKMEIHQITLDQLRSGQRGVVVRVGGRGPARRRMMDMGLVPGSEVKVVRVAPLGDPIEFEVKGYNLSLRKNEAREITVEVSGSEVE